ncbi:Peroxidasin homolog [Geodia barretti]|uniref:Peroxidasin homolog n=1 Tax=Geodia barretti TaxID=519541 RepID=A0AA35WWQ4_GEOBA|nr:Peroxidasin homolog [Geodia barretti]
MRTALLAALVVVAVAAVTAQYGGGGTASERGALIQDAVSEAKTHAAQRAEDIKAKAQAVGKGRARITSKHYKQASKEARRQGEARQLFENMVQRAERKLAEAQRKSQAGAMSSQARAEALASELFHRPGSLLTHEEISTLMTEAGCRAREEEEFECFTPSFQRFRTIDGVCNNLDNPLLGATDTALPRLIPSQYEDGISSLRGNIQNRQGGLFNTTAFVPPNPSARHVSQTVILDIPQDERLTHILMQFGQFIDHDLSLSPELEDECAERAQHCEFTDICQPIRVTDLDPVFGAGTSNNGACIAFSRSLGACPDPDEPQVNRGIVPRNQINVLTSFIDGSMIYGSDEEFANKLRLMQGGLLKEGDAQPTKKPELPRILRADNIREDGEVFVGCPESAEGEFGCFLAGEFRVNEQIVLTVMQTLWFREHNRVARELATLNPSWNDERLYQEARKIVGAIIQKIVYYDYLPRILGKRVYDIVVGEYLGYDPRINPGVNNAFANAAYRYGHTLIRPFFDRLGSSYQNIAAGPLELSQAFFDSDQFRNSFGTDPLTRGLITQNARRVDEFLTSVLTSNLFRTHLDLASLNIQRGRDHGLPPYPTWERYCEETFPELTFPAEFENTLTLLRFMEVYGSLDTVDLWIGGLAERREAGALLGPTFACLFGITFANIRDGDRFYYKAEGIFEPAQVNSIQQHSLAAVICDNSDGITEVQKDVFLTGRRVGCDQIPRIDLRLWQESGCHYRVDISARRFALPIRSTSLNPASLFSQSIPASSDTTSICVPVGCSTPGPFGTLVGFYPAATGILGRFLQVNSNPLIPVSFASQPTYTAVWTPPLFGGSGTGVHTSLASCESDNTPALTIDFRSSAQEISSEQEALIAQANDEDPADPSSTEHIPDDLAKAILEFQKKLQATPEPPTVTAVEDADAELMSDLEAALKSLDV